VLEDGDTTASVPFKEPGLKVYVLAPLAEMAALPPAQTEGADADKKITGLEFTLRLMVALLKQPNVLVEVTE
jgi:hypothetical protein